MKVYVNYNNKKWNNVIDLTKIKELNWNNYKVYLNNEYFGKYQLWHDDKWYAFDKDKKAVMLEGDLLAYASNYDIDVKSFTENPINDRTNSNSYVKKKFRNQKLLHSIS